MAKKNNSSTKPAAPAKREVKPTAKSKPAVVPAALKPVAAIAVKPKRTAKPAAPKAERAKPAPAITSDDIALRAYFIAEKRRTDGLPGDEHQDWVEAERQLLAEQAKPKKLKKA